MPIYEYACLDCGHDFEELIFSDEQPLCPKCESANAVKQISTFSAVSSPTAAPSEGPCRPCGAPRSCQ